MKKHIKASIIALTLGLTVVAQSASAANIYRSGDILRVMSNTQFYGYCMIQLSSNIGSGCPNEGWVSLDCKDQFSGVPGSGNRQYATALTAYALQKKVSVGIDNTKKHNGYCVAHRIDIRPDL